MTIKNKNICFEENKIGEKRIVCDSEGINDLYIDGGDEGKFGVVKDNGNFCLEIKSPLDFETKKSYALNMVATDSSNNTKSFKLIVNVKDVKTTIISAPLQHFKLNIANIDNIVGKIATERDEPKLFEIKDSKIDTTTINNNTFKVEADGAIRVAESEYLKYLLVSSNSGNTQRHEINIGLTVEVSDKSSGGHVSQGTVTIVVFYELTLDDFDKIAEKADERTMPKDLKKLLAVKIPSTSESNLADIVGVLKDRLPEKA